MFRFANPEYLYLLFILPAIAGLFFYSIIARKKAIKRYGNPELLAELMPEVALKKINMKFWLLFAGITDRKSTRLNSSH